MDKVQKIREEVERMHNLLPVMDGDNISVNYADRICTTLEMYIDSMQEEPVSDTQSPVVFYGLTGSVGNTKEEPQVIESAEIQHDTKTCKENDDSLTQESVSEDLEKEINEYILILTERRGDFPKLTKLGFRTIARHFANWQKQKDSIPVSEELEEVGKEWLRPQLDKTYANYGEVKMMELTHFDGYAMLDAIEFGANWKEQQLMAKAVDATVHIDAGGYPYIPQMELYDYDKDIPLAKEGDKYKVILIKENLL